MLHHSHHEHVLFFALAGFLIALAIFAVIVNKPILPTFTLASLAENTNKTTVSDTDVINNLNSKIKSLEDTVALLSSKLDDQLTTLQKVKTQVDSSSSQSTSTSSTKSILAVVNTKGSLFTTNAANYTPMGMYVNVRCPKNCYLWINFYTSSQNSESSHTNSYALFLNETDQGIYSQATISTTSSSTPVSLNTVIPVAAGFYTIDIRAKTSGGTLQSNVSALQVMAIER